jgi:hypothetical protein
MLAAASLSLLSCSRDGAPVSTSKGAGTPDGEAPVATAGEAPTAEAEADASAAPSEDALPVTPQPTEVFRRLRVRAEGEPILGPHLADVRRHFGDGAKLDLQTLRLSEARSAVLSSDGAKHLLLAIDQGDRGEASTIAWTKERPLAGTFPGATELALVGGPRGEVQLAWFDPTTKAVAFRRWRFDGSVEADWMLGKMDACDAISAVYWPTQGWLVAASNLGTSRLFLLDVGGTVRWKNGVELDLERSARAPLTLLPDSDASVIVAGVGTARKGNRRAEEHVLARRLDATGEPLWSASLDLGPAPPNAGWIEGHVLGPGRVAIATATHRVIEVASDGTTKPR